jgi:hypothetical protein
MARELFWFYPHSLWRQFAAMPFIPSINFDASIDQL